MPELRRQLQEIFGLEDFRVAQREVIEDVLAGRDVLCVMPTGAGKSLCYQFPAAVRKGLSIVVSPLISLMKDQVRQLRDEQIPALLLNSSLSMDEQREVIRQVERGFEGLLYVAPERFPTPGFQRLYSKLRPALLAVDEAHCISLWGHDFRPDYSRLGEVRRQLGSPPTIALTATATEEVRADIIQQLALREPQVYVTGFDRPNLRYESIEIDDEFDKQQFLVRMLREEPGSGIIYCATRGNVDGVAAFLRTELPKRPVFAYHAGMEHGDRRRSQERFMELPGAVGVATNAFGMGINKPDIRFVVHYNFPGTLEAYYQEAGRAGRDGQSSRCVILFSYQDRYTQEYFIDKIGEARKGRYGEEGEVPTWSTQEFLRIEALKEHARDKLEKMVRYAQQHNRCRRQMILDYFGDRTRATNCDCDVCRRKRGGAQVRQGGEVVSDQVTTVVRKLLSGIARVSMRGQFGLFTVAEVLHGEYTEKTHRWGFDELSVFGLMGEYSLKRTVAMLHRLIEAGLARQRDVESADKSFTIIELAAPGIAVMKAQQPPPATLADLLGETKAARKKKQRKKSMIRPAESAARNGGLDAEAMARFERLRKVRTELARQRGVPEFTICHDQTLREIAQAAPQTIEGLLLIKGMGPNKLKLYGQALLEGVLS